MVTSKIFALFSLASLALLAGGCAAQDVGSDAEAESADLKQKPAPKWTAPSIGVDATAAFAHAHTLTLAPSSTSVAGGGTLDVCAVKDEHGAWQGNTGAPGTNLALPLTASSIVVVNSADYEMLVELRAWSAPYTISAGGSVSTDGTTTTIPVAVASSLLYANPFRAGVAIVPAGGSIAFDIGAHATTPQGLTATISMACQPRHVFDAIPANHGGRLSYGGGARYEIGRLVD